MDGELWYGCYRLLRQVQHRCVRTPRVRYNDARIVEVFVWAVMHDRPVSWVCQRSHWPTHRRREPLPSCATMSRRLRRYPVIWMLTLTQALLREDGDGCDGPPACCRMTEAFFNGSLTSEEIS